MFAVVEIGGRQYKVSQNDQIDVNRIDAEEGKTISFDTVLLLADSDKSAKIGQPYVESATVEAKVVEHFKGEKVKVFKFIPKKRHQKTYGHRQPCTKLEITGIKG